MKKRTALMISLIAVGATVAAVGMADTAPPARVTIAGPLVGQPAPPRQPQNLTRTPAPLSAQALTAAKQAVASSLHAIGGSTGTKLTGPFVLDPGHLVASAGNITGTMRGMLISMPSNPKTWWVEIDPQQEGEVILQYANMASGDVVLLDCTFDNGETPNVRVRINEGAKAVHDETVKLDADHLLYGFHPPASGNFEVVLVPKHSSPGAYRNTFFTGCTLHPVL